MGIEERGKEKEAVQTLPITSEQEGLREGSNRQKRRLLGGGLSFHSSPSSLVRRREPEIEGGARPRGEGGGSGKGEKRGEEIYDDGQ